MARHWWGETTLEVDQTACWRVGPVRLWVQRRRHEWRVATAREAGTPSTAGREADAAMPPEGDGVEVVRFGFEQTTPRLSLRPVLAPRPVVCRPELPFVVHPGSAVDALVSSPLWLRLGVDRVPVLHEVDLHLPSRTWFGPDTRHGELCFASRTKLRLDVAEFVHDPSRAATRVHIEHRGEAPLRVAQIKVPVPALSLAAGPDGALWTESMRLDSTPGGLVAADVGALPSQATQRVSEPRETREGLALHRALAQFFG